LAEKRIFPCPDRDHWLRVRDEIYETIQTYGYNKELGFFSQAFESPNIVDASVLIMPMVFFSSPTDPRLLNTIHRILQPLEKGGLTTNSLVYRCKYLMRKYTSLNVC
jgi:GH15 family glucan-1,4-alpha-glucosidase